MRLYGISIGTSPVRSVEFVCPRCGTDRAGELVNQRRYASIAGQPVIRLGRLEQRVRCSTCDGLSALGVLDAMTARSRRDLQARAVRLVLGHLMKADGDDVLPHPLATDAAITLMLARGFDYSEFRLAADMQRAEDGDLVNALSAASSLFTYEQRTELYADLVGVGLADGNLSLGEQAVLDLVGVALGIPNWQIRAQLTSKSWLDGLHGTPRSEPPSATSISQMAMTAPVLDVPTETHTRF